MCFTTLKPERKVVENKPLTVWKIRKKDKSLDPEFFSTDSQGYTYQRGKEQEPIPLKPKRVSKYVKTWEIRDGYCSFDEFTPEMIRALKKKGEYVIGKFEIPVGSEYYVSGTSISVIGMSWILRDLRWVDRLFLPMPPKEIVSSNLVFVRYE